MKIYLDNGATTKVDKDVVKAMIPCMTKEYGNASSLHSLGQKAKEILENSRKTIAKYINAEPEETIFTSGGTESNNIAIQGVVEYFKSANKSDEASSKSIWEFGTQQSGVRNEKIHIITSKIEHPAVLNVCKQFERENVEVTYLDVDSEGMIFLEKLKAAIKPNTKLISIMHVNNEIGTIQPVEEIGRIAKEKNIIFHTDAVQSLTKLKIDVKSFNVDLMSFSAHKIHGPKGIGFLYVRKGTPLNALYQGGSHEFKKRPGTENIPAIAGLAKAIEIAKESDVEKIIKLRDNLINELLKIPSTQLNGSKTQRVCNNANIGFAFIEGEGLLMLLNEKGIAVSTGSACSSKSLEPSHVLSSLGLKHEIIHGSIRFTLSKYTTQKEIDYTIKQVKKAVKKLRKFSPLKEGVEYNIKDDEAHEEHCEVD